MSLIAPRRFRVSYPLVLVLFVVHVATAAASAQDVASPPAAVPGHPFTTQHVFEEVPGERQLTSRLIVRPWQRRALRDAGFSPREVVRLDADARRELARHERLEHVPATDDTILRVPGDRTEAQLADELMATGLFQYAEPDWLLAPLGTTPPQQQVRPSRPKAGPPAPPISPGWVAPLFRDCPDDPMFVSQWHHQAGALDSCAAWGAWPGTTGGPHVSIGFCDTGIRTTHEDLQLHRLEGYNAVDMEWESAGGAIGAIHRHGTRTTGTGAANGDNGLGISGVGWNFSHRMIRVSNTSDGNAFLSDLQHGARTSVESGDRVANVSYHGAWLASNGPTSTYIKSIGGLLVWGAGNTSSNVSNADRDLDDMIVVSASDENDMLAAFSSYGNLVDVAAPGTNIVTTDSFSDTGYVTTEGTSYACPITSGVCAMLWSARPNLSPNDVERILKASCDDIGTPGLDSFFGYGRINLARALGSSWSAPPVAEFAATPATGASPLPITFTDLSIGVPTSWLWDFGDGTTSTLQHPSHTYTTSGFFTVSLDVANPYGADSLTLTDHIAVDFIPPVAGFSGTPTSAASPYVVTFTDESNAGAATSWSWSFGDGASSTTQHPAHTYTVEGIYNVSLTASNAYGSDTLTRVGYVEVLPGPTILSNFTGSPTVGTAPLQVDFTDLSVGDIISWEWHFGDGATSTLQHPSHVFLSSGEYDIALTVTNALGKDSDLELQGFVAVE